MDHALYTLIYMHYFNKARNLTTFNKDSLTLNKHCMAWYV